MSKKSSDDIIEQMNEDYTVVMINGSTRIMYWQPSSVYYKEGEAAKEEKPIMEPFYATKQNMADLLSNQFVTVEDEKGNIKRVPAFTYWMTLRDRPTAHGVVMDSTTTERFVRGAVNTWRGFGITPKAGDCSLMLDHIRKVMCPGDPSHAEYFIKWLAWRVQNPTKVAEVAVVFRGEKGTGKGTLAEWLEAWFGPHSIHISDRKALTGAFNAHLSRCCVLIADEALWPGDKTGEGVLKRMITERTLYIEPKGINGYMDLNHLAIIFLSNEGWVVPATPGERRFAVFDVASVHRKDFKYFKALRRQAANGGNAALLHYLLNLELGDWHPREDVPQTDGLHDQMSESSGPFEQWLGHILEEGMLPARVYVRATGDHRSIVRSASQPNYALGRPLFEHFQASTPKGGYLKEHDFIEHLKKLGVTNDPKRSAQGTWRIFPPLKEMRAAFREAYPFWPAFSHPNASWMAPYDVQRMEEAERFDQDEEPVEPDFP